VPFVEAATSKLLLKNTSQQKKYSRRRGDKKALAHKLGQIILFMFAENEFIWTEFP